MIKKQILSCGVLFSLLGISKLSDFEISPKARFTGNQKISTIAIEDAANLENKAVESVDNPLYLRSLHFAQVFPPIEEASIQQNVVKYLKDFSFREQNSYVLHDLASSTFPKVEAILLQYGIPADFKYIPMLESRFSKHVTSPKGASGYWQFMPATARAFGLQVNDDTDERQDLVKSTHAAAKYLKALYHEFEDWALVAAAYNIGSGNLRKAISQQGEDNYFKLKLNQETSAYVYQLIAMKAVVENPALHGYRIQRDVADNPRPQLVRAKNESKSESAAIQELSTIFRF